VRSRPVNLVCCASWFVLRVPGIYGPGRLPLDRARRTVPAIVPRSKHAGNRVHVTVLVMVADRRIYNVTDGSEESHTEYLHPMDLVG
jgi:hypothetical protein